MGHGHEFPYKIPDYKVYKVENAPLLLKTQRALAAHGLKDPWIRNEVWRFDERIWGNTSSNWKALIFRGFRFGFGAFLVTIAGTEIYDRLYPSEHHHDHH